MGVLHIAAGGGAAFLILLAVSRAVGGSLGAATLFLAIVFATLTVGLTVGAGVESWQRRQASAGSEKLCSSCHRKMTHVGYYRVCESCDQIVVGS